nr:MAG TPA: hypothetical protein [Caudoviricetes sp.]
MLLKKNKNLRKCIDTFNAMLYYIITNLHKRK